MANIILYNEIATPTEQNKSKGVSYNIKLLKNDGNADLYIGLDHSVDDGSEDFILVKAGEYYEDWKTQPFRTLYYKSDGTVNFRLYSEVI